MAKYAFFQELHFHAKFPRLTVEFTKPDTLAHGERRLLAGMLTPVDSHPVTESSLDNPELRATWTIGRDVSITTLTASSRNSDE